MPRTILAAEALVLRCDVACVPLPAGFGHCQPVCTCPPHVLIQLYTAFL